MKKPNIIFMFSDQHRKSSMGFWQNQEYKKYINIDPDPVVTPNLDELAKGGIVLSIKKELGIPVKFIGIGEKIDDMKPFSADEFAGALFEVE